MNDPGERLVRAAYTDETVIVYQAYSPQIPDAAVRAGTFLPPFNRDRMTPIAASPGAERSAMANGLTDRARP